MSHWPILPPLSIIHLEVHCSHHVSAPLSSTWVQTLTCFTKHYPSLVMWTNRNNTLKHFSHVNVIHILGGRRWKAYKLFLRIWYFNQLYNYFQATKVLWYDVFKNSSWSRLLIFLPKLNYISITSLLMSSKKKKLIAYKVFSFLAKMNNCNVSTSSMNTCGK